MVYPPPQESAPFSCFEVDSTESIWYRLYEVEGKPYLVLKLTPQSQYGIFRCHLVVFGGSF